MEPLSLASLLLLSENDYRTEAASLFQSELLQLLVQYVDKFSAQMKKFLFTCFFPAAVLRLSVLDVPNNSALAISLVELLFYCVTTVSTQECKTLMIQQMLTPLCAALDRSAAIGSFGLACGVNLTHVAKSNPEMFKSQVIALTDNNRAVLQNSMRLAILQQGQATSTQQSSGTQLSGIGSSSSKRIDLSRFKKI